MPIHSVIVGDNHKPIKTWCPLDSIEPDAMEQLKNISAMPFVFKHVAAMPDVHLGKGATVGSVIASKDCIMPAAVGVDIGCGMSAVLTDIPLSWAKDNAQSIFSMIESRIPLGHDANLELDNAVLTLPLWNKPLSNQSMFNMNKAFLQMGSLGGGNHFIEICEDEQQRVWIMLHSGSRNIGKVVADFHINKAKKLMDAFHIVLNDKDLAYLPQGCDEFFDYINDLAWCQAYALENRRTMMARIIESLRLLSGLAFTKLQHIDCHHNFAIIEHHFGENVWITRKGAVRAREGDYGIIPGSMGTRSYIVKGKGNKDSFESCSHGAGRRMSRTAAKKIFTQEQFMQQTEGVICRKDDGVLDEIPGAYKDIDQVMEYQKDLVEVVATLKQFICVKG